MRNQKGIAFMPLLFWIAISVLGVTAVTESTGHHLSLNNLPIPVINKNNNDATAPQLATPPGSPSATPKVTPEVSSNQENNSKSQVNNAPTVNPFNATKTGNIIKYKEWCKGNQEISVYENELTTKQSSDGNTYSMTQGDWDCYEKSLVSCQLGDKWIIIQKSVCDKGQAEFSKHTASQADYYKQNPAEYERLVKQFLDFYNSPSKTTSSEQNPKDEVVISWRLNEQDCLKEKALIEQENNSKIGAENKRYEDALALIKGQIYWDSSRKAAEEATEKLVHEYNLKQIKNLFYDIKLLALTTRGCNF